MRRVARVFTAITSIALLAAPLIACDGGGDDWHPVNQQEIIRKNVVKVEQSSSVPFTYYYYIPEGASSEPVAGLVLIAIGGPYPATSYADVEETAHWHVSSLVESITLWSDIEWPAGLISFSVAIPGRIEGVTGEENSGAQALARDNFEFETGPYFRADLKFLEVVNHLKGVLADAGYTVDPQIFVTGFSTGGGFTNRVALLHPTLIKAAAPGAGGQPWTMPLASYQGTPLPYHIGVQDLEGLGLGPFDAGNFRKIPFFVFIGAEDTNDGLLECGEGRGCSGMGWSQIVAYTNYFGSTVQERAESFHNQLVAQGMNSTFKSYPGVGHEWTEEMKKDVINFFNSFPLNPP